MEEPDLLPGTLGFALAAPFVMAVEMRALRDERRFLLLAAALGTISLALGLFNRARRAPL